MRRGVFGVSFVAAVVACVPSALSFNALGHKVVAEIAWRELDEGTRTRIAETLRQHPRFEEDFISQMPDDVQEGTEEEQNHWIFLHASTWPDQVRGFGGDLREAFHRPTWHYVNLPLFLSEEDEEELRDDLPVNTSFELPQAATTDLNVVQATKLSLQVLESDDLPPQIKAVHYCWLFHLIGDIHQPFHSAALFSSGRFPDGDRGGNSIQLAGSGNLHSRWDGLLGRRHRPQDVRREVLELKNDIEFGSAWEEAQVESDLEEWVQESYESAREHGYSEEVVEAVRAAEADPDENLERIELPDSYFQNAGDVGRRRIIMAGVRLARMLEQIEDGEEGPIERAAIAPAAPPAAAEPVLTKEELLRRLEEIQADLEALRQAVEAIEE